jgi:hypothetical protein
MTARVSPEVGPKSMGSPGGSPLVVVVPVEGAVVVAGLVVVVAIGTVVVGAPVVVGAGVVVEVDSASSPAQATMSRPASKTPKVEFFLMPPRIICGTNAAPKPQVPVKSGFRFSKKAVMASVRSLEIR